MSADNTVAAEAPATASAADFQTLADLFDHCAAIADQQQSLLGPCPADWHEAQIWNLESNTLFSQLGQFTSLAGSMRAAAGLAELDADWQTLAGLEDVTQNAQDSIDKIDEVGKRISELAAFIDLGVAVAAFIKSPSGDTFKGVSTAYDKVKPKS
ncbi:hypothetical protein [Asticcacaulis solisilvae]|uniref:hypothetical protein n=1 Tax=Asticcacaulis solisilvae TaxID=1217274 RepID=UPI003FD70491